MARGLFQQDKAGSLLSVFVNEVQLNCHFFTPSVIEFDLDPREVRAQADLDALLSFMVQLAAATSKPALMTPENMHELPFVRATPAGAVEYTSSNGFFEELASDR